MLMLSQIIVTDDSIYFELIREIPCLGIIGVRIRRLNSGFNLPPMGWFILVSWISFLSVQLLYVVLIRIKLLGTKGSSWPETQ